MTGFSTGERRLGLDGGARSTGKTPGSVHDEVRALSLLTAGSAGLPSVLGGYLLLGASSGPSFASPEISARIICPRLAITITVRQAICLTVVPMNTF